MAVEQDRVPEAVEKPWLRRHSSGLQDRVTLCITNSSLVHQPGKSFGRESHGTMVHAARMI